jgi:predicted aldo/keto reductase-like oxidoreductase
MLVFASASLLQQKLTDDLPAETHRWFPGLEKDAQRAIQFVRSTPGIASALVGMSRREHLRENLRTAQTPPLNLEQFRAIFNQ